MELSPRRPLRHLSGDSELKEPLVLYKLGLESIFQILQHNLSLDKEKSELHFDSVRPSIGSIEVKVKQLSFVNYLFP